MELHVIRFKSWSLDMHTSNYTDPDRWSKLIIIVVGLKKGRKSNENVRKLTGVQMNT